jgi:hypothetical protein
MTQGVVRSPVNVCIQEGDMAICLNLHGEVYVGVDAVSAANLPVKMPGVYSIPCECGNCTLDNLDIRLRQGL